MISKAVFNAMLQQHISRFHVDDIPRTLNVGMNYKKFSVPEGEIREFFYFT